MVSLYIPCSVMMRVPFTDRRENQGKEWGFPVQVELVANGPRLVVPGEPPYYLMLLCGHRSGSPIESDRMPRNNQLTP